MTSNYAIGFALTAIVLLIVLIARFKLNPFISNPIHEAFRTRAASRKFLHG